MNQRRVVQSLKQAYHKSKINWNVKIKLAWIEKKSTKLRERVKTAKTLTLYFFSKDATHKYYVKFVIHVDRPTISIAYVREANM